MSYGTPGQVGEQMVRPVVLSLLAPKSMWKPLSWDSMRQIKFPLQVFRRWCPLRVTWSHTVHGQPPPGARGKGESLGLEVQGAWGGGAPVFELHSLLLPRAQTPSLGADGEYAIVLHTHLVQLSAVKLCSLCP